MMRYVRLFIVVVLSAALIAGFLFLFKRKNETAKSPASGKISQTTLAVLKEAQELETNNDIVAAKELYQKVLYEYPDVKDLGELQNKIYDLNIKILFSPILTANSQQYEVVGGDSLAKIAKKFNTTVELIKKANRLSTDLIRPGMKLKIENSIFSILVDKSQNILILLSNQEVLKVYIVSTGKDNSTPVGTFKIVNKLIDPPWFSAKGVIPPDSPENVLGTRWLGIDQPGYGIHGTSSPESIGSQCTEGCVRMRNSEVEELYAIVPEGAEVTIID